MNAVCVFCRSRKKSEKPRSARPLPLAAHGSVAPVPAVPATPSPTNRDTETSSPPAGTFVPGCTSTRQESSPRTRGAATTSEEAEPEGEWAAGVTVNATPPPNGRHKTQIMDGFRSSAMSENPGAGRIWTHSHILRLAAPHGSHLGRKTLILFFWTVDFCNL